MYISESNRIKGSVSMDQSKSNDTLILIIWSQALIATVGSLFYSEVMNFIPCDFCWYQRILMYPLVVIYGVYAIKKDVIITIPGLILSGIGIFVASYHYLMQKLPIFEKAASSCGIVPCNSEYVNYLGFITIPFMALIAFTVIFSLNVVLLRKNKGE